MLLWLALAASGGLYKRLNLATIIPNQRAPPPVLGNSIYLFSQSRKRSTYPFFLNTWASALQKESLRPGLSIIDLAMTSTTSREKRFRLESEKKSLKAEEKVSFGAKVPK